MDKDDTNEAVVADKITELEKINSESNILTTPLQSQCDEVESESPTINDIEFPDVKDQQITELTTAVANLKLNVQSLTDEMEKMCQNAVEKQTIVDEKDRQITELTTLVKDLKLDVKVLNEMLQRSHKTCDKYLIGYHETTTALGLKENECSKLKTEFTALETEFREYRINAEKSGKQKDTRLVELTQVALNIKTEKNNISKALEDRAAVEEKSKVLLQNLDQVIAYSTNKVNSLSSLAENCAKTYIEEMLGETGVKQIVKPAVLFSLPHNEDISLPSNSRPKSSAAIDLTDPQVYNNSTPSSRNSSPTPPPYESFAATKTLAAHGNTMRTRIEEPSRISTIRADQTIRMPPPTRNSTASTEIVTDWFDRMNSSNSSPTNYHEDVAPRYPLPPPRKSIPTRTMQQRNSTTTISRSGMTTDAGAPGSLNKRTAPVSVDKGPPSKKRPHFLDIMEDGDYDFSDFPYEYTENPDDEVLSTTSSFVAEENNDKKRVLRLKQAAFLGYILYGIFRST
jgi:hypothetical protein